MLLHHANQLATWQKVAHKQPFELFVKINSGMNRVGFSLAQVDEALAQIEADEHLSIKAIMTHFATADEQQIATYQAQIAQMTSRKWPAPFTLCNNAALYLTRWLNNVDLKDTYIC